MHADIPGCAAWNADAMLASLRAWVSPAGRHGRGSGVEPTSRDQQIELYESLFSARRPFLLTETHTANLSTGARNINGPLAGKPLERSRRSQNSRCTQQGFVLMGLGVTGFERDHRGACVGWRCSAGLEMGHGLSFRHLSQSLCGAEVLSWTEGRMWLVL